MNKLLGDIPYLNGGLFQKHEIETKFEIKIEIGDNLSNISSRFSRNTTAGDSLAFVKAYHLKGSDYQPESQLE
jgi:hypothetical protein